MLAIFHVLLDAYAKLVIHNAVKVVGYLLPHMAAVDDYYSLLVYHGLTFFHQLRGFSDQAPSMPGANASRICNLARNKRVFTLASVMPNAFAVSAMFTS